MAAKYFDVYIRRAWTRFTDADMLLTSNLLSGWDKIGIAPEKSFIRAEPVTTLIGDGNQICEGFNVSTETGEKSISLEWYNYLRTKFHRQLCDFLYIDHEQPDIVWAAFGILASVYKPVVSGESVTIAIAAKSFKPVEVALGTALVLTSALGKSCLVEIECWDTVNRHGVNAALVSLEVTSPSRTYAGKADFFGIARFLVETPTFPTVTKAIAEVTATGYTWHALNEIYITHFGKHAMRVDGSPS